MAKKKAILRVSRLVLMVSLAIAMLLSLAGCRALVVHLYLRAVMSGGNSARYLAAGTTDEVVKPYVIVDYKVLNSSPYRSGDIQLGTTVRTEITFKSQADTPLHKLVQFLVMSDYRILRIE